MIPRDVQPRADDGTCVSDPQSQLPGGMKNEGGERRYGEKCGGSADGVESGCGGRLAVCK